MAREIGNDWQQNYVLIWFLETKKNDWNETKLRAAKDVISSAVRE